MLLLIKAAVLKVRTQQLTLIQHLKYITHCITALRICQERFQQRRTAALSNATLKYSLALANKGWQKAMEDDAVLLLLGLSVHEGKIMYAAVAAAHG
jgi:alanine dehydrogenase